MNEITLQNNQGFLVVSTLQDALKVAEIICKSSFCPKSFVGKPGDVLVAMQWGQELGLKPLQALQNISVINGRPAIWGDAMMALCQASPHYEYVEESYDEATQTAYCKAKRKGDVEKVGKFSKADAQKANLWGKNVWASYPERMLQMRARGFALRDAFADVLKGLISAEEARDYPREEKVKGTVVDIKSVTVEAEPITAVTGTPNPITEIAQEDTRLITPDEVTILADKAKEAGSEVGAICGHYKIASLHFVTKSMFPKIMEQLDRKIARSPFLQGLPENTILLKDAPRGTEEMHPEVAEFFAEADDA